MADYNQTHKTAEDFDEYRRQMHPEEEPGRSVVPTPRKAVAIGFGIFMIILYVGVGVLLLINFFKWETMAWARYFIGILLIVYGIFRAYRQIRGSDYYGN